MYIKKAEADTTANEQAHMDWLRAYMNANNGRMPPMSEDLWSHGLEGFISRRNQF